MTLEEILAHAAKVARSAFHERGEVRPMWCGHTAANELVFSIPERFGNTDDKEAAIAAVKAAFKLRGVVMYAFMTEAWVVDSSTMPPQAFLRAIRIGRNESLEHHPDRREIIQIQAEDRTRCVAGIYRILRPEHGKATLSPFIKHGDFASFGRMTHLLDDCAPVR